MALPGQKPSPVFLLDTDATITVCHHAAARRALRDLLKAKRAAFVPTVVEEIRRLTRRVPPVGHAIDAAGLLEHADDALGRPAEVNEAALLERTAELQARLQNPRDDPRGHLGEAACMALAETNARYAIVSDDRDARTLAAALRKASGQSRPQPPQAGSSAHLAKWMVQQGLLEAGEFSEVREAAGKADRGFDQSVSVETMPRGRPGQDPRKGEQHGDAKQIREDGPVRQEEHGSSSSTHDRDGAKRPERRRR